MSSSSGDDDDGPEVMDVKVAKQTIIDGDQARRRDISLKKREKKEKEEEAIIKRKMMVEAALEELKSKPVSSGPSRKSIDDNDDDDDDDDYDYDENIENRIFVKKVKTPTKEEEEEEIDEVRIEGSNEFIKIIDSKPKLAKMKRHQNTSTVATVAIAASNNNTILPSMVGKAPSTFSSDRNPVLQEILLKKFERTERPPKRANKK